MRALVIAAALFFAVVPAYAQGLDFGDGKKGGAALAAKRQAEQDQAYRSSLQRIPAKEAASDPWGSLRGTPPSGGNPSSLSSSKKPQPANPAR